MGLGAVGLLVVVLTVVLLVVLSRLRRARRAEFIAHHPLPRGLYDELRKTHPQLQPRDCQLVAQGLRQFFTAHLRAGMQPVAMPSQVADDLWHAFILHTRAYEAFCAQAFGRFMHHTPAVVLTNVKQSNASLRRCWWHCCRAENIDPRTPRRLPLLFALDTKYAIAGGFHYVPDCGPLSRRHDGSGGGSVVYCGTGFSDASADGSTEGFGDGGNDGGGDGGGGGGDGGGGGCGSE